MIMRRDDWRLDIPEDRAGLRNVLAVALVVFCIFAVVVAVDLTVADDESATPAKYTNPDGAPPYCVKNFMEAGVLCNTDPEVVKLSKLALYSGDTESAAHRWAKECANNGDPIDDCLDFAKAPLTGLLVYNATYGIPTR